MAVRLRLDGHTVAEASRRSGLSAPTVSAAWKAFREGGWEAVSVKPRGRRKGSGDALGAAQRRALRERLAELPPAPLPAWNSRALAETLKGKPASPRAIEHWWAAQGLTVPCRDLHDLEKRRSSAGRWFRQRVRPVRDVVNKAGGECWQGGVRVVPAAGDRPRCYQLYLHGKRGALHMRCLPVAPVADDYLTLFERLLVQAEAPIALLFHGAWFQASPEVQEWLAEHLEFHLINVPPATPDD
ncbi:helix-turn-helix domain-containing protein [Billgrantia azerbaijanica]|nr:helix-turn-helix domain-containing protein [Halomonas azerbaijanica]